MFAQLGQHCNFINKDFSILVIKACFHVKQSMYEKVPIKYLMFTRQQKLLYALTHTSFVFIHCHSWDITLGGTSIFLGVIENRLCQGNKVFKYWCFYQKSLYTWADDFVWKYAE